VVLSAERDLIVIIHYWSFYAHELKNRLYTDSVNQYSSRLIFVGKLVNLSLINPVMDQTSIKYIHHQRSKPYAN